MLPKFNFALVIGITITALFGVWTTGALSMPNTIETHRIKVDTKVASNTLQHSTTYKRVRHSVRF